MDDQMSARRPAHSLVRLLQTEDLLEALVALGNRLGITMIAEGIETLAQRDRLIELHCPFGQGFLFSPAVPLSETVALFTSVPAALTNP
jgi:EAL domain-containing protein (putative c-di-GMP-specific phosphodiesterase class I)